MLDIQNTPDTREIPLQKVGVKNVRYPVQVLDKNNKTQNTTATVNLFVNLPHNFKGTHMSRFIEVFHKYHSDISMNNFLEMLEEIRTKLEAERSFGKITFPYFIKKAAPVSKSEGYMEYLCTYEGECFIPKEGESVPLRVHFVGRYTFQRGTPPQRPRTKILYFGKSSCGNPLPLFKGNFRLRSTQSAGVCKSKSSLFPFFWIEDIITTIENCASTALYSVLKRQDEKYVTEHAYDNPRFVEDVVREVYLGLKKMNFKWFNVEAETEESIHFHNAYACAEYGNSCVSAGSGAEGVEAV